MLSTGTVSCSGCTANLRVRLLTCRACGYQALEGDNFCLKCSADIEYKHFVRDFIAFKPINKTQMNMHVAKNEFGSIPVAVDRKVPGFDPLLHDAGSHNEETSRPRKVKKETKRTTVSKKFVALWITLVGLFGTIGVFTYLNRESLSELFTPNAHDQMVLSHDDYYETEILQQLIPEDTPSPPVFIVPQDQIEEDPVIQDVSLTPSVDLINQRTIATSLDHSLAITVDGGLWAWGSNSNGQLGGGADYQVSPIWVHANVVSVYAAFGRTVAIAADNSLWAFGRNERGQLGDGTTTDRSNPVWVMGNVVFVYITEDTTFVITSDNSLWAWGANEAEQLGDGTTIDRHSPTWIRDNGLEFVFEMSFAEENEWQIGVSYIDGIPIVAASEGGDLSLILTNDGQLWSTYAGTDEFFRIMADVMLP